MRSNRGKLHSWPVMALGLLAAMVFLWSQKNLPVTAEEPVPPPPRTVVVDPGALTDHPVAPLPTVQMDVGGKRYTLEVASTPEQMARGLMFRTELPGDRGMLFPFEPPRRVNFWMKNTKIPLDMVFIRDNKVVNIVHQAQPCTADPCRHYPSVVPVDRVIELPAGAAQSLSLDYGSPVSLVVPKAPPSGPGQPQAEPAPTDTPQKPLPSETL